MTSIADFAICAVSSDLMIQQIDIIHHHTMLCVCVYHLNFAPFNTPFHCYTEYTFGVNECNAFTFVNVFVGSALLVLCISPVLTVVSMQYTVCVTVDSC